MSNVSIPVATLGTPRIGPRRELKRALEAFWSGRCEAGALLGAAAGLRAHNWARQAARGVAVIPSNDFSLYDHVLDTSAMVGAVPAAYGWTGGPVPLDVLFAMARGTGSIYDLGPCAHGHGRHGGVAAQEMTKWFDTNYHYLVPEVWAGMAFRVGSTKPVDEFREALALGHHTRPVLLGPVTFLKLAKSRDPFFDPLSLLDRLLPVYADVLHRLAASGAAWVQMDEPCLALDLGPRTHAALARAYGVLAREVPALRIMLAAYFGALGPNRGAALALPVAGLHLDLVRAPEQLDPVMEEARPDVVLSLGVVDGRNVWRSNLPRLVDRLSPAVARLGAGRVQLAPSCSLLHVPVDLDAEAGLDPKLRSWLSFSAQKMDELAALAAALSGRRDEAEETLRASAEAAASRASSSRVHEPAVARRMESVTSDMAARASAYPERAALQRDRFRLPAFPTTTIGSFPQTAEVRQARAAHDKGALADEAYDAFLREETARVIRWQEEVGLDVLVHGEFERNDMVQYFGERLNGFAFTQAGWVQSYGSRCVRPPVLFGDVSRPAPMTVAWWRHAQSLTERPVKAMLTGPVTILNWSFVRDDLPRAAAARQIALAIRDEVLDLERAGAAMIQIDEAALREGLPLREAERAGYLDWAVEAFRLCAAGVADRTQVHTHMCYSEFNEIIGAIAAMDADVISIEASRSGMELLDAFESFHYPAEVGPGVWDIHSPRVPDAAEMVELLALARRRIPDAQLWVNPDCGLKTRGWPEVRQAVVNMVEAARLARSGAPA